jgi:hypothetical protein
VALDEKPVLAEQFGPVEEAVKPPTRRLAEVEARQARAAATTAAWVKRAPRFAFDEVPEEAVQGCLENGLEAAQDEVASGRRVDDEPQMVR